MNFIPINKMDLDTCIILSNTSDKDISPYIYELLTWLQDYNWPVASRVEHRLIKLNKELVEPIKIILKSDDTIWKYWLLSSFLLKVELEVIKELRIELDNIVTNPTIAELVENLNIASKKVLFRLEGNLKY